MPTRWRKQIGNERGIVLPLALIVLSVLTVLVLTFLSLGGVEPQISRNLADTTRARYVAEAGIEWAFDALVANASWNALLTSVQGNGCPNGNGCWMVQTSPMPGLAATAGTFSIQLRNDTLSGDDRITGQPVEPGGNTTTDSNGILIVTATGALNGATRQVQVAVQRLALPPFPGGLNIPGVQADTFIRPNSFDIDGRDYNRDGSNGPGPLKYGVQVQPGIQTNTGQTYEATVESAFNTGAKQRNVKGREQGDDDDDFTTGLETIAPDASLNPGVLNPFLGQIAASPATTVLQSTMACPMVMTGSSADPSRPTLTNGCSGVNGVNQQIDLGTPANPKLVYFRGDLDTSSRFTGLRVEGQIQGAGILIVEDGDLRLNASSFRWDGIVMVVGRYVGVGMLGGNVTVYGAMVSMETISNEVPGFYEFLMWSGNNTFRASKQNLDMVQSMRALHRIITWREI